MKFDAAGHLTENHPHTYTLPYGFKTITTNGLGSNTAVTSEALTTTSTIADNTQDTLAIDSGDKWIRIVASTTNNANKITISHDIHSVTPMTDTGTLSNKESAAVTFAVPTYSFDSAGHYSGLTTKTWTMPYGYGIITGDTKTDDKLDSSEASATFDTLAINGDTWIKSTVTKDTVTLTHKAPIASTAEKADDADKTPSFGNTFDITDWQFDSNGHKNGALSHTVKIPGLELITDEKSEGDVLVSLEYAYNSKDSKGVFTQKSSYAGNLTLGAYEASSETDSSKLTLSTTSTISGALAVLDKKIDNLEAKSNPVFDTIESDGVYILKFTVEGDNKTPEWVKLDEWTGGKY